MDTTAGSILSGHRCSNRNGSGFFFEQYFSILRKKAGCRWFFEKQQFRSRGGDPSKEREAWQRAIEQSEETFKKVGWRQLIITLLDKKWFNEPGKSAIQSVQQASFEDAVRLLSIENASK